MDAGNANSIAELECEERLRFETLIAELSSKFINLPADEVDGEIKDAQSRICDLLGLDFSALWQWSDVPPGFFTPTHFYSAQTGSQPSERMNEDQFPWARKELLTGHIIKISSPEDLPAEAARDRETLHQYGIISNLALPLSVGGKPPLGFLGIGTTQRKRDWPDALVKRLKLMAQVFANALARKLADQALRESEERMSLAVEAAEAGLWVLDCKTEIFWVTEQTRRLFGWTPDEAVNMECLKAVVHPDDWDRVSETIERSLRVAEPVNAEYRIRHGDGCERWIASRGRPGLNAAGEPDRLMGVSIDITERKRNEETLRASKARLSAGSELAGLGYYEVDYGKGTCFLDERFRDICGVPPDVQHGLDPAGFWLEHVHPGDRERVLNEREKLHDGSVEKTSTEYRYLHPAGGQKWIHHLAQIAAHSPIGPEIRTFGGIRDITREKQTELDTQELRDKLTHSGRVTLLGQLASSLAHELSQPLGAILRNAEAAEILLQESSPDVEELGAIVTDILMDDRRAGDVIDRLRSLLKRGKVNPQPVELPSVIDDVISLLHADAAARRTKIAHTAEANLPKVRGDRIHLQQVLLNLIVNAMDALGESSPDAPSVVVEVRQADPDFVEVSVSDNGRGIPVESLERLFEPFFTLKSKGLGVGLAVSRTIIEAHGGKIWAENGPEGGACFRFTVPVDRGGSDQGPVISDQ